MDRTTRAGLAFRPIVALWVGTIVGCFGTGCGDSGGNGPTTGAGMDGAGGSSGIGGAGGVGGAGGSGGGAGTGGTSGTGGTGGSTPGTDHAISAGWVDTCALTTGGAAKCWGDNRNGQLGDGSTSETHTLIQVSSLTAGVVAITAGLHHTCALASGGAAKCWGANYDGQLGDGSTTERHTPFDVNGLGAGVTDISAGNYHTCAVVAGAAKCWGYNANGELGNGNQMEQHAPVQVRGLDTGAKTVSAAWYHTCAVTTLGAAKCWGGNDWGQLGNGSRNDSQTPVDVSGLSAGVQAISAGSFHTCALTANQAVKCWGENASGQLGNASTLEEHAPVDVSGLSTGVTAISAGSEHTCALTTSGGVKCWGKNEYGELGNGSTVEAHVPVDVSGLASGVVAISAGSGLSCALVTGGAIRCWGHNASGQLGDGSTRDRHTPVSVVGFP